MKAVAKHDCSVTLTTSLDSISLNRMGVKKGQVIELPVHEDKPLTGKISETLGNRSVIFVDSDLLLVVTYSKDFDYIKSDFEK